MLLRSSRCVRYATRSLHYFENDVLLAWAIVTPVLQWIAVWIGRRVHPAPRSPSRRPAV